LTASLASTTVAGQNQGISERKTMKHIIATAGAILFIAGIARAKELDALKATYDKEMEAIILSHGMQIARLGRQYAKSLDTLLATVKETGDLDKTTAVLEEIARFEKDRAMPETRSALPDIQNLQSGFARQATARKVDKAKSIISLISKYDHALEQLQKSLVSSDKLDEARTVQEERGSIRAGESYTTAMAVIRSLSSPKPDDPTEEPFDWKRDKKSLSYSYATRLSTEHTKGASSYADSARKKLLDGVVGTRWGSHAVGWAYSTPPAILFRFRKPVRPKILRLHIFGGEFGGGVSVPREIRLYTGSKLKKGDLIAKETDVPNRTGWVELPIQMPGPSISFVLELDRGDVSWVLIDEIEFR